MAEKRIYVPIKSAVVVWLLFSFSRVNGYIYHWLLHYKLDLPSITSIILLPCFFLCRFYIPFIMSFFRIYLDFVKSLSIYVYNILTFIEHNYSSFSGETVTVFKWNWSTINNSLVDYLLYKYLIKKLLTCWELLHI